MDPNIRHVAKNEQHKNGMVTLSVLLTYFIETDKSTNSKIICTNVAISKVL